MSAHLHLCLLLVLCAQAIEKLKLDNETPPPGMRPKALGMVSSVGVEYVQFKSPMGLENKVCWAHAPPSTCVVCMCERLCVGVCVSGHAVLSGYLHGLLAVEKAPQAWKTGCIVFVYPYVRDMCMCMSAQCPNSRMHDDSPALMRLCAHTQVEEYLNDVITKMRSELRSILKDSVNAYPTKPRHEWLFDWPSQIILVVNQIYWCQEVEQVRAELKCVCGLVGVDVMSMCGCGWAWEEWEIARWGDQ